MPRKEPDPNLQFRLLLTFLNADRPTRWQEVELEAWRRTEPLWSPGKLKRAQARSLQSMYFVDPVPPGKIALLSQLPPDLQAKVKRDQFHVPTDYREPLQRLANLLIQKGPGPEVAEAFNRLVQEHTIWTLPQVFWSDEAARFVLGGILRPGAITDPFVLEFSHLLLSPWASRLRRCPTCHLYFVAPRLNQTYCLPSCKDRFWTRPRRRQAGHKPYRRWPPRRR